MARAVEFDEAQIGALPVDSVGTLGVGRVLIGILSRTVPVTIPVAILHNAQENARGTLPWLVELERDFSRHRMVQAQADTLHAIDEPVVDEGLHPGGDVQDRVHPYLRS